MPRPLAATLSYLTQAELARLFEVIRASRARTRLRDLTLFSVIYRFGLRRREAADLPRDALDLDAKVIRIVRLKGGIGSEYAVDDDLSASPATVSTA